MTDDFKSLLLAAGDVVQAARDDGSGLAYSNGGVLIPVPKMSALLDAMIVCERRNGLDGLYTGVVVEDDN